MKRLILAAVCILAALCMVFSCALAAPRYPAKYGAVTDSAAVFSAQTTDALNGVLKDVGRHTDGSMYIVTVDFLDGYPTASYLTGLREAWGLDAGDTVLLFAVGEDTYGVSIGKGMKLSEGTLLKLMSTHVAPYISLVDYDRAMASFIPALLTEINKTYNAHITAPAFGMTESGRTPYQANWLTGWTFGDSGSERADDSNRSNDEDDDEFSFGKIVLALILISWVFGSRKSRRRGCGCGCSPVARLLAALKIWDFFDKD